MRPQVLVRVQADPVTGSVTFSSETATLGASRMRTFQNLGFSVPPSAVLPWILVFVLLMDEARHMRGA